MALMSEEERVAHRERLERIKREKLEEYKKVEAYHQQLKTTNLNTFQDRPDPISEVRCIRSHSSSLEIEWDEPPSNNSPIICYNIYISE